MLVDVNSDEFASALARASDEVGLPDYYRSCVHPLFMMPVTQWPLCCAGSCDPCAQKLVAVAARVCELVGVDRDQLP